MIKELTILFLITFLPLIELRLAIPVGILAGTMNLPFGITLSGMGLNPILVWAFAIFASIILGFVLINFLEMFDKKLKKTRIAGRYLKMLDKSQRKMKPYVDKYGLLGIALFISLPIPGSGVYMGSLGSFVLGISKKKFYVANLIGVIIASTIVTILTVLGKSLF